jgi:hypothetical protein
MPRSTALSLTMPSAASPLSSTMTSPTNSDPPSASPQSIGEEGYRLGNKENQPSNPSKNIPALQIHLTQHVNGPTSPNLTSLPPFPSSPRATSKHMRDQSKSFFANLKASKSSNRVHQMESTIRHIPEEDPQDDAKPRGKATLYSMRKGSGSTPDLSKSTFGVESSSFGMLSPTQPGPGRSITFA